MYLVDKFLQDARDREFLNSMTLLWTKNKVFICTQHQLFFHSNDAFNYVTKVCGINAEINLKKTSYIPVNTCTSQTH